MEKYLTKDMYRRNKDNEVYYIVTILNMILRVL